MKNFPRIIALPFLLVCLATGVGCDRSEVQNLSKETKYESTSDDQTYQSTLPDDAPITPADAEAQGKRPTVLCKAPALGIVNGQDAADDDEISRSTVRVSFESANGPLSCSGTIIGPRHILTATHCLSEGKPLKVFFGPQREAPVFTRDVVKYIKHPRFTGDTENAGRIYDSSVLLLNDDIAPPFKAVSIAKSSELVRGNDLWLAGFGRHSETDSDGQRSLAFVKTELTNINAKRALLETTANNAKGSCDGDAGGSLYIVDPASQCLKLAGSIVGPLGSSNCDKGGDLAMDVTRYQGWISCSFAQMGSAVAGLTLDGSEVDCDKNIVVTLPQ